MTLHIGTTVKNLRSKHKVTQEQLAVYLGVTPQAISRWEAENGYPDIELLPAIAAFFGITTDELLGVHKEEQQARLEEIHRIIDTHNELGTGAEAIPEARRFAAEFPGDEKIQEHLADTLCRSYMWEENPDTNALTEAERIYRTLADRTEDMEYRGNILESLAVLYAVGFRDPNKAVQVTEQLPSMRFSREETRSQIAFTAAMGGDTALQHYAQDYIDRLTDSLATEITGYMLHILPNESERWDEKIAVFEKLIELYRFVYGENQLFYHGRTAYLWRVIATYKVAQKKYDETLDCLEKMCTHALLADEAKPGDPYTSPFTDRLVYPENGKMFNDFTVHNNAFYCREKMNQSRYDPIRTDPRFAEILRRLEEGAK